MSWFRKSFDLHPTDEEIPAYIESLASRRSDATGDNCLASICFDGYLKLPSGIGTSGRTLAVITAIGQLLTHDNLSLSDIDLIIGGIVGTITKGVDRQAVLPHLRELENMVASLDVDTYLERIRERHPVAAQSSEYKSFVASTHNTWRNQLSAAIGSIQAPQGQSTNDAQTLQPGGLKTDTPEDFVQSALRRKTQISIEFGKLPELIDALRGAQKAAYPGADMGEIGEHLQDAFAFTCPKCGQLKSSAVLTGAVVKSMQGRNPRMATVFGGPNIAGLSAGRCPGCGGTRLNVYYDPHRISGLTPLPDDGEAKA